MRIDRIKLKNFKLFSDFELKLHPEFTLLIGENGSGKTSILDALAIGCGIWMFSHPDREIHDRSIDLSNVRVQWQEQGDRSTFVQQLPFMVETVGQIDEKTHQWKLYYSGEDNSDISVEGFYASSSARKEISRLISEASAGKKVLLPIIAYYGANRANGASELAKPLPDSKPRSRWEAFQGALKHRIDMAKLRRWFADEMIERRKDGSFRPGFEVVKKAILKCVPGADDASFDTGRADIVLSINGNAQPMANLSAGQRTMLALVADIAIKCVIQNNYLVPPDRLGSQDDPIPRVLKETPGVVLIDEIDVHLHPRWQRRVIEDLRTTFPSIQFVATTHSPFIVQSMRPEELHNLQGQAIPDLGNIGVEEIARGLMNVPRPDVSQRYDEMVEVAKSYLLKLEEADKLPKEKLEEFESALAKRTAPYADNPAFQAFLELKKEGKLSRLRPTGGNAKVREEGQ